MTGEDAAERGIKSDHTLFSIIEYLREVDGAGVTEIADEIGVSKSTVYGHLTTMRDYGFVVKRDQRYALGLGFFDYGQYVLTQIPIFRAGREAVDRLEEETGEMAWLITHQDGKAMYIYGSGGQTNINPESILGTWTHMHCNSGGKAILAHLPDPDVDRIIEEHGLPARTENTITERNRLHEELADIRDQGYALNLSEDLEGIHAVGVPLLFEGDIYGALSVAGPAHRMPESRCAGEILDELRAATNDIELNMAYR